MASTIKKDFFLIVALLLLLVILLNLEATLLLYQKSVASKKSEISILNLKKLDEIKNDFWKMRFLEKSMRDKNEPNIEEQFGEQIRKLKTEISEFDYGENHFSLKPYLKEISSLIVKYEDSFDNLIQMKTSQRMGQTILESNFQALSSQIIESNDIELIRLQSSLGIFHREYLILRTYIQYNPIITLINITKEKIKGKNISKKDMVNNIEEYQVLLKNDLEYENKIKEINKEFNNITNRINYIFEEISFKNEEQSKKEISQERKIEILLIISFVFIAIIGMFLIFLIIHMINTRIINPLKKLLETANKVKTGDLDIRFSSDKKDEISSLGFTFNEMLESLKKSHEEIKKRSEELEKKNKELERFNKLTIGRELKMVELKKENEELNKQRKNENKN